MKYNSDKSYSWAPDTIFEVSGADLGFLVNTLREILSTQQAKQILVADRANSIIENIIATHVEKGTVTEIANE